VRKHASPPLVYTFEAVGVVRSPYVERVDAPRQAALARDVAARIELFAGHGYEHALDGLAGFEFVWVVFVFHKNIEEKRGWKAKVLPPRSNEKHGVFATRSPHRPNPVGISAVALERIDGLVVHVRGVDLLDGTPVLDLKPYVAYADAHPEAGAGWLETRDPVAPWTVVFGDAAKERLEWLRARGVDLKERIEAALALGPQPHPYRRIRRHGTGMRLAIKEWRVDFTVDEARIVAHAITSGYRAKQIATDAGLALHRKFIERFGIA
jgi:tRNA-Thr(GGU) m(6)t(6)A37 methyltransferase TsaA